MCSRIVCTPRRVCAICTAVAPERVFTFRTNNPTDAVYSPPLVRNPSTENPGKSRKNRPPGHHQHSSGTSQGMPRTLRAELGVMQGTVQRVATQLGYDLTRADLVRDARVEGVEDVLRVGSGWRGRDHLVPIDADGHVAERSEGADDLANARPGRVLKVA